MNLTAWQEYVKDNNLTDDQSLEGAIYTYGGLKTKCNDAYEQVKEVVDLMTDYDELQDLLAAENPDQVIHNHKAAVRIALNAAILEALEEIEDMQSEFYQEGVADREYGLSRQTEVDSETNN